MEGVPVGHQKMPKISGWWSNVISTISHASRSCQFALGHTGVADST